MQMSMEFKDIRQAKIETKLSKNLLNKGSLVKREVKEILIVPKKAVRGSLQGSVFFLIQMSSSPPEIPDCRKKVGQGKGKISGKNRQRRGRFFRSTIPLFESHLSTRPAPKKLRIVAISNSENNGTLNGFTYSGSAGPLHSAYDDLLVNFLSCVLRTRSFNKFTILKTIFSLYKIEIFKSIKDPQADYHSDLSSRNE